MPFKTINPSDQSVLAEYSFHSREEAFDQIQKFSDLQNDWKNFKIEDRAIAVKKVASQLRVQKNQLARQATLEMGKPISQALSEIEKCAVALETIADLAVENLKDKEDLKQRYKPPP